METRLTLIPTHSLRRLSAIGVQTRQPISYHFGHNTIHFASLLILFLLVNVKLNDLVEWYIKQ